MSSRSPFEKFAVATIQGIGSISSIVIHTLIFAASFGIVLFGFLPLDRMLLVLTTILSLEAIYLSLFIQMSVNINSQTIEEVSVDVGAIQKDIDEIQEDVEEIGEDVGEIQEDVDEIQKDVDELQEDVEEIGEDVDEMAVDEKKEEGIHSEHEKTLAIIQADLRKLLEDIDKLKR